MTKLFLINESEWCKKTCWILNWYWNYTSTNQMLFCCLMKPENNENMIVYHNYWQFRWQEKQHRIHSLGLNKFLRKGHKMEKLKYIKINDGILSALTVLTLISSSSVIPVLWVGNTLFWTFFYVHHKIYCSFKTRYIIKPWWMSSVSLCALQQ